MCRLELFEDQNIFFRYHPTGAARVDLTAEQSAITKSIYVKQGRIVPRTAQCMENRKGKCYKMMEGEGGWDRERRRYMYERGLSNHKYEYHICFTSEVKVAKS